MAKRGRKPGVQLTDEHRSKIKNSQILNRLIAHVEGKVDLSSTQVTAGLGLLKKAFPDLSSVELDANVEGEVGLTMTVRYQEKPDGKL